MPEMRLVPVEPTEDMLAAAVTPILPSEYRAMLAAAPPVGEEVRAVLMEIVSKAAYDEMTVETAVDAILAALDGRG